jgi:hypothetical protein
MNEQTYRKLAFIMIGVAILALFALVLITATGAVK